MPNEQEKPPKMASLFLIYRSIKIKKTIYIGMRIKPQHLDTFISCPATGKIINTTFLDKELYEYYYNNGYDYIFSTNDDNKSEIELDIFDEIEPIDSKAKKN